MTLAEPAGAAGDDAASIASGLEGEITVGSILPLTGDLATHGEETTRLGVAASTWPANEEDSQTNPVVAWKS